MAIVDNLDHLEVKFLEKFAPSYRPRTLSKVDSLTAKGWEEIQAWVAEKKQAILAAPSIRACAHLAKHDGVSKVSVDLLKGCSSFMALRKWHG